MTKVSIAIVTWNNAREIAECLAPLASLPENWEVWVADNASADRTVEIIGNDFPRVRVIANVENLGFAKACNQIVANTGGEYVLFLNPDSIASKDALEKALHDIERDEQIGVLGVRLSDETGDLQKSAYRFPNVFNSFIEKLGLYRLLSNDRKREILLGDYFDHQFSREVDWLYGAFMLSRRSAIEKAGGIPEDYFLFAEDLDFCYLVKKAGYKIWFSAECEIIHKGNQSAGQLPSIWRVERTILSKYAFCFNRFGWFRTRLIQLIDISGNIIETTIIKLRRSGSPFLKEAKIYRAFIKKALKMSKTEVFQLINRRPE